jgi:hypothetical protein
MVNSRVARGYVAATVAGEDVGSVAVWHPGRSPEISRAVFPITRAIWPGGRKLHFALSGPGISQELTTYQVALWQGGRKRSDPVRLTTPGKESFPTGRTKPGGIPRDKRGLPVLTRCAVSFSRPRN